MDTMTEGLSSEVISEFRENLGDISFRNLLFRDNKFLLLCFCNAKCYVVLQ